MAFSRKLTISILEKELSEPFRADYQEIVKKAREKVRDDKE